jgi:uncharacterized protein (UPF0332 family)
MDNRFIELSKYRYETAVGRLKIAKNLLADGEFLDALNRSYYSVFHGIRSLLALDGVDYKKHSGVISYFNQYYIKTGIFEKELARIITSASEYRNDSDYEDFFIVSKEEVEEQVLNVEVFLNCIELYLKDKWE